MDRLLQATVGLIGQLSNQQPMNVWRNGMATAVRPAGYAVDMRNRFAWTTQTRCPHTHSSDRKKEKESGRKVFRKRKRTRNGSSLYTLAISTVPGPSDGVHLQCGIWGGEWAMQGWAERPVEVTEQEIRQQPQIASPKVKKTPLALRNSGRDRGPRAAISVWRVKACRPVPAEREEVIPRGCSRALQRAIYRF